MTAYFKEVASRLGRDISVRDFTQNPNALELLKEFTKLKSNWPYRRDNSPGPCNFFFENGLYPRPAVYRAAADIRFSCYESILVELDSGFSSTAELETAEELLDNLFFRTERAIV